MKSLMLALLTLIASAGVAHAQSKCLHGTDETADQKQRRSEAVYAARSINNIEINQAGYRKGKFIDRDHLASSPFAKRNANSDSFRRLTLTPDLDILPNWRLTLDLTKRGYWFAIVDTSDPCGFAYISNQEGLIRTSQPIP